METTFDTYTLRLVTADDLQHYYGMIDTNRKRLEDFFAGTVAITQTLEDTEKHLTDIVDKMAKDQYFSFVVVDNEAQKLIASIQVKSIDRSVPKGELGYYVDAGYEGKGIVSRAVGEIIDFCFAKQGFNKLYIRTFEGNMASRKVAEKNGFQLEGVITCDYKTTAGVLIDTMYYGLKHPSLRK